MSNDLGVTDNDASKFDSGIDMSSFGSSESDWDTEKVEPLDDRNDTNKFFKEKTPKISDRVLAFNAMSSDESDVSLLDNYSPIRNNQDDDKSPQKYLSKSQDESATPKINKSKLYNENTPPQIMQAKQQLEKLMKQLESKSAQKSAELEKVNQQLMSHSAELNKYNHEIEAKLLELRKAQNQLHKFVSESSERSSRESSFADDELNNSQNQVDKMNKDDTNSPKSDVDIKVRSFSVPESPTKAIQTSDEEKILPGSPEFNNLYQQLDQANNQLEKLQNQLQQFFNVFDPKDNGEMNDYDFSKLIEKVKKDKELTDSVKSNFPEISSNDIIERSINLEPQDTAQKLEKAQNQLQQFYDIFNPGENKKENESFTDEDFENLIKQAKKDKDLSHAVETALPLSSDLSSSSAPMNIDEIISQINNLRSKSIELDEVQDKLKNTKEQLDSKSNELDDVQNQLKDASEQLNSKSSKLDEVQNQLKDAKEKLGSQSTKLDEVQNQLKDANQQLNSKSNELDEVQNQLKDASEQLNSKSSKLDELQDQLNDAKEKLDSKSTKLDEVQNQLKDANEQLNSKSNELDEVQNQLKDANEQLGSKSSKLDEVQNQLKDASEQLGSKSNDLNQANKKLENVCKIIEAIEGEKINPDQITNKRISGILEKMKKNEEEADLIQSRMKTICAVFNKTNEINDEEFAEMVATMRKNKEISDTLQPSLPDNFQEKSHDLEDKSAQFNKIKQQFNSFLQAIDDNNEIKNFDEIADDQLSDIIDKVTKNKQIADAVKSSFSEDLSNPDDVREKIENLEEKSTQFDKMKQQFNSVIQAIGGNNEASNPAEISDDQLNQIIEKAEKDKQISEKVQSSLPYKDVEFKTREVKLFDENSNDDITPYDKIQNQLDELISIFSDNENESLDNQQFEDIIKDAKNKLEISQAVKKTLPHHSSCGEEVQTTINILKLRSAELERLMKQYKPPYSDIFQLRKRLDFLTNTIACLSQSKNILEQSDK